jgi:hypothetical protein
VKIDRLLLMVHNHNVADYARELVPDLTRWYEGNESEMAFADYMKAKIEQRIISIYS